MKKIVLSLMLLTFITGLNAQIIFSEDFDGMSGPTAGGAGTYVFPPGWLLRNVDNRAPATNVSYVNEAWERREDFNFNVADSAAFSTSWYSPAGPADDWMWTPLISNLPANAVLNWNAVTYDPSYPDGYEVRIMTQASSPGGPTGGAGVMGNQVTNSTQIFTIAAENTTWTTRTVNLNAYTGQSVWIAFRNTSNDKFILLIDDVIVQVPVNYDASVFAVSPLTDYSQIPLNLNPSIPLKATIKNMGAMNITNVVLNANVYDALNNLVFNSSSSAVATLAPGATSVLTTAAPFIPAAIDNFRVDYAVSINETDQNLVNNTRSDSISITDSVFARDRGVLSGTLGIGAGNGGNLGQQYVLTDMAKIASVSIFLSGQVAGSKTGIDIFNFDNGLPTTLFYSSPVDSIDSLFTGWLHFPVPGSLILMPDTYVVAAREIDSTMTLGNSIDKFTTGTVWVNWPTSPSGGWTNVETFGTTFSKTFMVRLNLLDECDGNSLVLTSLQNASICAGSSDTLIASGGGPYSWDGIAGNDTLIVNPLSDQTYTLTSVNQYLCIDTATIQINVNDLPSVTANSSAGDTVCAGTTTILTGGGALSYTWTNTVTDGMPFIPASTLTYTVTGTDTNGCSNTASVEIYVDPCVSINAYDPMPDISVFPNPGNGEISVTIKESMLITVYNALGEVIINEKYHQGINYLNLMKHDSGIYFIKATTDSNIQHIIKFIKID